ncbi:MAG: dihydroneopterin aldolase [Pelagibacteraceae bacterium]|nr:dihydroneopterin aldolase [Pelagibacteraceae bacterium]
MSEKKIIQLKESNTTKEEIILINDLNLNAIFGFYDYEKIKEQELVFNLKLYIKSGNHQDKKLDQIVDYDKIIYIIKNILKNKINFLETLAEKIIDEIFSNRRILKIYLKIEKPQAIKECKSVGYEIIKTRSI